MRAGRRWLPRSVADRSPGKWAGTMQGKGSRKITLHTSESAPGSINGVVAWVHEKHTEYHLVIDDKAKRCVQMFPFHKAARSLKSGTIPGGGNNKHGKVNIQICVVGYAKNDPVAHLSPWALGIIKTVADAWGVPLDVVDKGRSRRAWRQSGIFGHKNSPKPDDHTDPGRIPPGLFAGLIDREDKLTVSRTIRKGSTGRAVRVLQRKLGLGVDGKFGSKTRRKLKRWQRANGLAADGVAGPKVWRKLGVKYVRPRGKVTKNSNTRWPSKYLVRKLRRVAADIGQTVHIISGTRTPYQAWDLRMRYLRGAGNLAARCCTKYSGVHSWSACGKNPLSNHADGKAADCSVRGVNIGNYPGARDAMKRNDLCLPVPGEPWHCERGTNWRA